MSPKDIEDYLQEGIYGSRQTKPEERHAYLGSLRERAELILTVGQVMTNRVYPEVEECIKRAPGVSMLLNGDISYPYLSKYIKLANTWNIPFTIVQNEASDTPVGLLLTHSTAVDREDILVHDDILEKEKIRLP